MGKIILILWLWLVIDFIIDNIKEENQKKSARK